MSADHRPGVRWHEPGFGGPPSRNWRWQHLLQAGRRGGLGVSHCPAMKSESRRAWSPGSPPPQASQPLPQRPFEKSSPPPSPRPRPSGGDRLWGQGPGGLPTGPRPGPGRRQPTFTMSVKTHRGQPSIPREGASKQPESLGGQRKVTRIQRAN